MKELKIKSLWVVELDGIQMSTFKYKKDAKNYAIQLGGVVTGKKKVITDKY
jgi:hypothetical protein